MRLSLTFFSHFLLSLFLALALHYQQQHSIERISIFLVFSQFCRQPFFVLTHTHGTALAHFSLSYFCCNFFISCFAHTTTQNSQCSFAAHTTCSLCNACARFTLSFQQYRTTTTTKICTMMHFSLLKNTQTHKTVALFLLVFFLPTWELLLHFCLFWFSLVVCALSLSLFLV